MMIDGINNNIIITIKIYIIIAFVYQAIIGGVIGGVVTVVLVLNIGISLLVIAAIRKWQKRGGESI